MSASNDRKGIYQHLEQSLGFKISRSTSLAGGSINEVFLLDTSEGKRVVKINNSSRFPRMFQAEKEGLEILQKTRTFDIPQVFAVGEYDGLAYLLLEHKAEGPQNGEFWHVFSENLAALHRNSAVNFGFPHHNYIGSLPQYNDIEKRADNFYITQRLEPQLKIATDKGFTFNSAKTALKNIAAEIPLEAPALIHGDLWSGNYLVNNAGLPCLIDPAACYGPREMDLAMMKLFGGFPDRVFQEYHQFFPLEVGIEERVSLWHLYYLLVHLNLFGSSYFPSVESILKKYS